MHFTYDQLDSFIHDLPIAMSLSECHGVLTGLVSAGQKINHENWFEHVIGDPAEIEHLSKANKDLLAKWHADVSEKIIADDLSFALCLPHDDEPLNKRLSALADWCHGFLYGLAASGDVDFENLPPEATETMADLGEVGKVDVLSEFDDGESESDLLEIIEYVRMAALSLYDDIQAQFKIKATTDFINKTIH